MSSYFDGKGNVLSELLDGEAKRIADTFVNKNSKSTRDTLTSAQMRRFFSEMRQLEKKVKSVGFDKVKPLIKMVKSKITYASNPSSPKIPASFKSFMINNIDNIHEEKDFKAFQWGRP